MTRFDRDRTCLWLPPGPSSTPPPAILFLHGIGERGGGGADLSLVRRWGLPKLRSQPSPQPAPAFPFLVVAPQCPADARWCDPPVLTALDALLDGMVAGGAADPRRIALAGFSMGGVGTFCVS